MNREDDSFLIVPEIANVVMPGFAEDRQMMSSIDADMKAAKGILRDVFLQNGWIKQHDGLLSGQPINVVDGSSATATRGEFAIMMALAVNVSVYKETEPRWQYHKVFAPNCESFGAVASPVMSAAEAIALAHCNRDGYTLYDGSLLGLNMNLGNLFRTQDSSLPEISEYSTKLDDLFHEVATPGMCATEGDYVGPSIYSSIFNKKRGDIFAISKKSTSTYAFHRIKEEAEKGSLQDELPPHFFAVPKSDRLMMGQILKPGEWVGPTQFKKVELKSGETGLWGVAAPATAGVRKCNSEISLDFLNHYWFLFFKPAPHMPALRIELIGTEAEVKAKTPEVLSIVAYQCQNPGIVEPYGLWLADKLAKQIQSFKSLYGTANAIQFPELFKPNRTEDISK